MQMPGRKYQQGTATYRFSINGQEKSTELNDNLTTALYWEYDSRIVRRWNVDPVLKVGESPYLCFSGNPVFFSDPSGDQSGGPGPKIIVLDPGHGGNDGGTPKQKGKRNEADITLLVVKNINARVQQLIKEKSQDGKTVLTRDSDVNPGGKNGSQKASLNARVKIAKDNSADLYVSIHVNSGPTGKADYVHIYTKIKANDISKTLQKNIIKAMTGVAITNQGVSGDEASHQVTREQNSNVGAVLVEIGFISNPAQEELMNDDNYLLKLGNSIGDAVFNTAFPNSETITGDSNWHPPMVVPQKNSDNPLSSWLPPWIKN